LNFVRHSGGSLPEMTSSRLHDFHSHFERRAEMLCPEFS
jgi:hypothetical protein